MNPEDKTDDTGPEVWQPSKPPPPMPKFPDIPESLRKAGEAPGTRGEKGSPLAGIGAGWALALDFVGTIVAAWLLGFLVDRWQKTTPWGSLVGLGIGFAYAIVRILRQSQKEEERSRRK